LAKATTQAPIMAEPNLTASPFQMTPPHHQTLIVTSPAPPGLTN
jgi:hypothetical protein